MGLQRRGKQHHIVIALHHQGQTERRVGGSSTAATSECVATGFETTFASASDSVILVEHTPRDVVE
jgi:hypothetical protein